MTLIAVRLAQQLGFVDSSGRPTGLARARTIQAPSIFMLTLVYRVLSHVVTADSQVARARGTKTGRGGMVG